MNPRRRTRCSIHSVDPPEGEGPPVRRWPRPPGILLLAALGALLLWSPGAPAQDDPDSPPIDEGDEEPGDDVEEPPPRIPPRPPLQPPTVTRVSPPADFPGTLQLLRAPVGISGGAGPAGPPEIFPDANRVWMSVRDIDPIPVETARRGGKWLCSTSQCTAQTGDPGHTAIGDSMLRSIKLQTATLPLPITIWGRMGEDGLPALDFDPVLLGRRSYAHVCAYKPISTTDTKGPRRSDKVPPCRDGRPAMPTPDSGEVLLGLQWPKQSEMADFRYLAIVDSCGNARVQPFQRTFTVPVFEVASGGCGKPDGKVLRIFPSGGWIRVTAFNLDAPAASNIMNATYRVSIPPLENLVESNPARMLFPDPQLNDLKVDCGPLVRKAPTDARGIPRPPPGAAGPIPPGAKLPPGMKPGAGSKPGASRPGAPAQPPQPAPPPPAADTPATSPGPQSLSHQGLVIAPEPLRLGNCRIRLTGQTKRRLVAPLSLYVSLARTDRTENGAPIELLSDGRWIVTPSSAEFPLPPLSEYFDGDSRLKLSVFSDPLSPDGKVVLLSDAGRVASSLRTGESGDPERARRLVGSAIIHSAPLCGESNFETTEAAGSCLRAYLTIPAMLATLQITRAPWVEKPLITRSVLSAIGVALAMDSYNPVERRAFPIAGQIGGAVQSLGDGKVGLLGYLGIAPTIPVLGSGGNTTSFGFLAGVGVEYITNEAGPDEGLKPAAFVSVVVQVGQASPELSASGKASFGTYSGE